MKKKPILIWIMIGSSAVFCTALAWNVFVADEMSMFDDPTKTALTRFWNEFFHNAVWVLPVYLIAIIGFSISLIGLNRLRSQVKASGQNASTLAS